MAVITDIQAQKRTPGRYSIYVNGAYSFSLSDLELSNSGLRTGQELNDEEVATWQKQSTENKGYNLALRYLGYRARSQREMRDYLVRKSYEPEVVDHIITRLTDYGFLNDAAFADSWIASRLALRPRSRRMLEQELLQKGLDRETIATALAALGHEGQEQMLTELIERKRRQLRYQDVDKLMQYLARQGFGYDQIKKALARLDD